jgi:hypothetical protein
MIHYMMVIDLMNIKIRICPFQKSALLLDTSGTVHPRAPLNEIPRGHFDISRVKGEEILDLIYEKRHVKQSLRKESGIYG